jgi:putative transposase
MLLHMRIRSLNHSTYQHQYHIVWGTKYRYKYLKDYVRFELFKKLREFLKKYPTLHILAINVDQGHIHLQIEIPPNVAVAVVVQKMKAATSFHLKKKFKFIDKMYLDGNIWGVGYFSSTIGLNENQIRRYIEHQGKDDLPQQPGFEFS